MSIGLEMTGEGADREAIAAAIEARDDDPRPRVSRTEDGLLVALHPGAEEIELTFAGGRVTLRASTTAAGPGYHQHVVALAEALDVRWDEGGDPTGWRDQRDPEALEELYLDWLGAAAARMLELEAEGVGDFMLNMPAGVVFTHDQLVATQLGPRSREWLTRVRDDARAGLDAFPFWGAAKDAAYFRGLALVEMWSAVRWRPPITEEERALLEGIASRIEKAHGLDPELPLPWAEQSEILTLLDESSLRATRAHLKAQSLPPPALGYRRHPVQVELSGGWWLTVPGELAERWDERGTWVGWDEGRSVFFNSFVARGDGPTPSTEDTLHAMPPLDGDEILELERGDLRGIAALSEVEDERGELVHRLEAHAAIGPHAAIGTLIWIDPAEREWALTTWGSLDRRD
ncbi:MAG: hypothetical protein KC619_25670 [Myxococcales bacterium]|nr:hypothetical protein [Myxococcales bacterium]